MATLGLSPLSQNFTSNNTPIPSLLGTIGNPNNTLVPSTTWTYTAGAVYKSPPVFGSVTFGGYDANRIDLDRSISVPFWTDPSRDLLLGLQSITYDTLGSSPLLADGIYVFIDSLVAQMWLPLDVCQAFESAFGLEWDNITRLLAQSPSFEFTVGPSKESDGNSTVIKLPYAAFDLNVTTPYYNQSQRYFPLKRAQNDTQYTLGRAFLQEAYVIADYDRRNFTIGQALFPSSEDIQPILLPGVVVDGPDPGLSTGAIAGIAIAGVVILVVVAATVWWCLKKRKHSRGEKYAPASTDEKFEGEYFADKTPAAKAPFTTELRGDDWYPELPVSQIHRRSELSGHGSGGRFELPVNEMYELSGGHNGAELDASNVR
jgi:hypothetical protein